MAKPLVSDELWNILQPLLPPRRRRFRYPGRKPLDDRKALTGILFVLKTRSAPSSPDQLDNMGRQTAYWRSLQQRKPRSPWAQQNWRQLERPRPARDEGVDATS